MSEIDEPTRPQYLAIDAMKLQLLTSLNILRLETLMFYEQTRSLDRPFAVGRKMHNSEVTKFVVNMNERLDLLLSIAKNLLKNPNDMDGLEYKQFEELANKTVRQGLIKKKYGGLIKKRL